MKIRVIGTDTEQAWLASLLRAYTTRNGDRELRKSPKSGLYTRYFEVKPSKHTCNIPPGMVE